MWNKKQIQEHIETAKLLDKIKNRTFELIKNNKSRSEKQVQEFILKEFKENKITTDKDPPIVAFNENSAIPHYFLSENSKTLKPNTLILIDIWANKKNQRTPFADITWVGYYSATSKKIPKEIQKVFDIVIKSRDEAIKYIRRELKKGIFPTGKEIDSVSREIINKPASQANSYMVQDTA